MDVVSSFFKTENITVTKIRDDKYNTIFVCVSIYVVYVIDSLEEWMSSFLLRLPYLYLPKFTLKNKI